MIKSNRLTGEKYEKNFSDIHPPYANKEAAVQEANRCLFCYDAPCVKQCPTSINIPKFIKQITTDNIKGSATTIFNANIFGGGCARVCPVEKLCEGSCVYNLLHEKPIEIAKLQRYATDKPLTEKWNLFERKPSIYKKVAIIGAGPSGLSCAHVLSREGVDVTIFEKDKKGGGLMTYGIAAYKVTPEFCEDEISFILSLGGIEIEYDTTFGTDVTLHDLQKKYDAVYLSPGVGLTNRLNIPGEELQGVEDAISFIYKIRDTKYKDVAVGDNVIVIGMGMTAIDAATQAKRLGAKKVTIVYRRSEEEKSCTQTELDIAYTDGCVVEWMAQPKSIVGENGNVKAMVFNKMKFADVDMNGKRSVIPSGETLTLEADMIIKATGQKPFEGLINDYEIENHNGKVKIENNGKTNLPNVFAGGDCVTGGKEVVDAVQAGKDGAAGILNYLNFEC
ncbi:MAG: NAD(P)-dependent oxidoreductase [Ginsengibacter sp.]